MPDSLKGPDDAPPPEPCELALEVYNTDPESIPVPDDGDLASTPGGEQLVLAQQAHVLSMLLRY